MYRVGTCSWTDQTLLNCGRFYPEEKRSAEQRLRFYAQHFDTVEVDSSFYNLPNEKNSWLWVERTPAQFTFNIKAYRSLTLHDRNHPPEPLEWQMFASAIRPLAGAGKLGYVLFQFPPWFVASDDNRAYILECRERLPHFRLGVQFRHISWLADKDQAVETMRWLRQHDLPYVATDEPQFPSRRTIPPVAVSTAKDLTVIRFNGRNRGNWFAKDIPVYERFHYRYADEELAEWVPRIITLAERSREVFVMFNNCFEDDAIVNAKELLRQLQEQGELHADKLYLNTYEPQAPKIAAEQSLGLEVERYLQPMTREQLQQNQLAVSGMIAGVARLIIHGPLISTDLEQLASADATDVRRIYRQSCCLAAGHGINRLVFHSGFVPNRHISTIWLEQSVDFWRSLLSELPSAVVVYIENMVDDEPRLLCQLHDQVADTRLKLCLDLGHANCNSPVSPSDWIAQLGGRIGHVHLHNNDGRADRHWTLSRGTVNIESALSDLARYAPEASYTLECDSVSSLNWLAERGYI